MYTTVADNDHQKKIFHDKIVWQVAGAMTCKGYTVMANHPRWAGFLPYEIDHQKPDIIATKDGSTLILEIETCDTFSTDLTKNRLHALTDAGRIWVIVPSYCTHGTTIHSPALELKKHLAQWGMPEVRVGTCDPETGSVDGPD